MPFAAMRSFFGLLVAVVLFASDHGPAIGAQAIELTPEIVGNFIESYPKVQAKGEQLREQFDDVPGGLSDIAAWRAWTGAGGARSQLDALVGNYGFPDFSTWIRTLSVIVRAYGFTQGGADLDNKMAEALARVENDPNIPDAQKEMMRQQLKHSAAAIAAMKPSQRNIDAVDPFAAQLGQLFDSEGGGQ